MLLGLNRLAEVAKHAVPCCVLTSGVLHNFCLLPVCLYYKLFAGQPAVRGTCGADVSLPTDQELAHDSCHH